MDHSHLQALLENYGYIAVFFGALLEGETVLIMAGFAAHRALLHFPWVVAVAAAGGFLGDQTFFALGRYRGRQMLARFPSLQRHAARVDDLINRHSTWLIVGVRFMYGLRVAGPVLIGMSQVPRLKFVTLNAIGAVIWAVVVAGAGYLFGQHWRSLVRMVERFNIAVVIAVVVVVIYLWWRQRHNPPAGLR